MAEGGREAGRQQGSISAGITQDIGAVRATMADQAARSAAAVQTYADVTYWELFWKINDKLLV